MAADDANTGVECSLFCPMLLFYFLLLLTLFGEDVGAVLGGCRGVFLGCFGQVLGCEKHIQTTEHDKLKHFGG